MTEQDLEAPSPPRPRAVIGFLSPLKTPICLQEFLPELFQLVASCVKTGLPADNVLQEERRQVGTADS